MGTKSSFAELCLLSYNPMYISPSDIFSMVKAEHSDSSLCINSYRDNGEGAVRLNGASVAHT
jgi:hypothetical protein